MDFGNSRFPVGSRRRLYPWPGPPGKNGTGGSQGPQGAQGATGTTGSQGTQGRQGFQGTTGSQGNQGSQGTQGNQGTTGAQGPQGFQGNQGTQGNQGNQGSQGMQGVASNGYFLIASGGFTISSGIHNIIAGSAMSVSSSAGSWVTGANGFKVPAPGTYGVIVGMDTGAAQEICAQVAYNGSVINPANFAPSGITENNAVTVLVTCNSGDFLGLSMFNNSSGTYAGYLQIFQIGAGAQGLQGFQGNQGTQGSQGTQGNQGTQGSQGSQGNQGIAGIGSLSVTTQILASPAASITFSSISGSYSIMTYDSLVATSDATQFDFMVFQLNGDTGGNYDVAYIYGNAGGVSSSLASAQTAANGGAAPGSTATTHTAGVGTGRFAGYATTTLRKTGTTTMGVADGPNSVYQTACYGNTWRNTAAISAIKFLPNSGGSTNFTTGSTISVSLQ